MDAGSTERLDQLVRHTTPDVAPAAPDELHRTWDRIAHIVAAPEPRRPRRRAGWVAAAVGALAVGTAGVAGAGVLQARTGEAVPTEEVPLAGPGEWLVPAGDDFDQVIADETADIPFPDEASRTAALAYQSEDFEKDATDTRLSSGALRSWVAKQAICAWSNAWAGGLTAGDAAAADRAAGALTEAAGWPAVTAVDPHPSAEKKEVTLIDREGNATTTTMVTEATMFHHLIPLNKAIAAGDVERAAYVLASQNNLCWANLVPNIPTANPMANPRTNP